MVYLLYLLLSSVCALFVVHLLKRTEVKGLRTLNTLTVNYLVAALAAFLVSFTQTGSRNSWLPDTGVLFFCLVMGLFFISNYIAYSKSVHTNGMGISVAAMRLSLLVPILVSVYFYGELLAWQQVSGIILVFGAFLLLIPPERSLKIGNMNASWLLLIVFLLTGLADASLKVYNEEFSRSLSELTFMGWIYTAAFGIGALLSILRQGSLVSRGEAIMGLLLGIPNLYSAVFLIYALEGISGAIAFSVVNILNVLGGTLLGVLFWKDKVTPRQWGGIAVAIIAILLLI